MKVYFYNSYQNSLVGFQLCGYDTESNGVTLLSPNDIESEELKSILLNSGSISALGKTTSGNKFFVIKKLEFTDLTQRLWSVNFAVEADKNSAAMFENTVFNILADLSGFQKMLGECLIVTADEKLSYSVNAEILNAYFLSEKNNAAESDEFFNSSNQTVKSFKNMLKNIGISGEKLEMLAVETTKKYFYNQNPVFAGVNAAFEADANQFDFIMQKNAESLDDYETKKAELKKASDAAQKAEEEATRNTAIKALAVAAAAAVCAVVVKKIFFRR